MPPTAEKKDPHVFIQDVDFAWIPGKLIDQKGDKATVEIYEYKDEQSIRPGKQSNKQAREKTVNLKDYQHKVLPLQNLDGNGNVSSYSDMVQLPYLHEAAILYNLKDRHQNGNPYTRTGDIIIAVNPFQWFNDLYTEQKRAYYSNRLVWEDSDKDAREGMEPHVYEISALSYKGLAFEGVDQSILVSGESGAGKTETVKICMNHMASVQQGPVKGGGSDKLDPVVQRVVDSNPLLEAFGNAKTRRNDNSSRFGKYLQLQFDNSQAALMNLGDKTESKCRLAGSTCDVYLLEKNRIVSHDTEERTFHIFYQLLAAPDAQKKRFWPKLAGKGNDDFSYVGHTNTTKIEGMSDADHFAHTVKVLEMISVKGDKLDSLMQAICVVMQLGNLKFGSHRGDSDKSEITSKQEVNDLADLMGVSTSDLSLAFTERTMKTKMEEYKVPLNREAAKDASDALAKEVYGKLFLWLVNEINNATRAEDNYKKGNMSNFGIIGLLDIFGFESFAVNRFEQLCINYANEKLQQKFTEDIFRSVQTEYEAEGIELAEIWYDDNTDVLDLIEGRTGLLALLNEECVRPKGTDQGFVQKALQQNSSSPCLITNKMDRMSFGIHHYAGKVMYDAEQFVVRNQDTLPTDLGDLCQKSTNHIICSQIEGKSDAPTRGAPKRAKSNLVAPTVWGKYKTQLAALMSNLRKTSSRYIRCIKPNMKKKPVLMEHVATVEQLRCAGVVAAVTLSRSAFPNRLDNAVVRYRYASMWDPNASPSKRTSDMSNEEGLRCDINAIMTWALRSKAEVDSKGNTKKAFVVGKTRTYFRAGALEYLESNRLENGLDAPATVIQKYARGYLVRNSWSERASAAKEAERLKREQEERRRKEADEARKKADQARKDAEARQAREEKARKEREAREERERQEKLERLRREQEERLAIEREELEHAQEVEKLKRKYKTLKKEAEEKRKANEKKVKEAENEADEIEAQKNELQAQFDDLIKKADQVDKKEIAANKKRLEESDKIVAYLRKENKKVRDATEKMKEDMQELKEQNGRLIEANASAGASLDSLEKQKKNLAIHNQKIEENLKKYKAQNSQLKSDLANRVAYHRAETQIRALYENAMEKIIEFLEDKCNDTKLISDCSQAQLQCEAIAANKMSSNPALASSDVSDF